MVFRLDSKAAEVCKRLPEALSMVFRLDSKGPKVCKSCGYRQDLSNDAGIWYLLAKFCFDTAENERLKVCQESLR